MAKPLIVYLDTHDYSKLYSDQGAQMQSVYQYLCAKVDAGEILIPYSYFIIAEFLTSFSGEYRDDRLKRVTILKRLCNKNTFRFINANLSSENVLSTDGHWYPDIDAWSYLKEGMNVQVRSLLKSLPPSKSALVDRRNPWPALFRFFPQLSSSISQGARLLPVPKSFSESHLLVRYLKGQVSEATMRAETETMLADLDVFFSFWFENDMNKNVDFLHQMIRAAGEPYIKLANDLIALSYKAKAHLETINGLSQSSINFSRAVKDEIKTARIALNNFLSLDVDFVKSFLPDKTILDRLPPHFGDTILKYATGVARDGRRVQDSDTGDLMHSCYLPYCDIWRGDVKFSNLLIAQGVAGYEKIVKLLTDLPSAIDLKLNSHLSNSK